MENIDQEIATAKSILRAAGFDFSEITEDELVNASPLVGARVCIIDAPQYTGVIAEVGTGNLTDFLRVKWDDGFSLAGYVTRSQVRFLSETQRLDLMNG